MVEGQVFLTSTGFSSASLSLLRDLGVLAVKFPDRTSAGGDG